MCQAAATSLNVTMSNKIPFPFQLFQYADDTLIFASVKGSSINTLALVLRLFSSISGLAINHNKSAFVPLNLPSHVVTSVQSTLGYMHTELPITYLGMPLTASSPNKASFIPLLDKIKRRLDGWRGRLLSRAGRLQLCKSVISSIPIYFMSCFKLPPWLIKSIGKVRRSFIWSSGDDNKRGVSLINWSLVCTPKDFGGLGLPDLKLKNMAMLMRWWWRLYSEDESIWKSTASLLFSRSNTTIPPLRWIKKGSFFWQCLLSLRYLFQISTNWQIGNATRPLFWFDNWGFGNQYSLHGLSNHQLPLRCNLSLANAIQNVDNIYPRPHTREHSGLFQALQTMQLTNSNDVLRWKWDPGGRFNTASTYHMLVTTGKISNQAPVIWNFKVTPSIQLFCYFWFRNRLLTQDRLHRWNFINTVGCSLCSSQILETPLHLFFHCRFAQEIWQQLHRKRLMPLPVTLEDCCSTFKHTLQSLTTTEKDKATVYLSCGAWCLWKERNARLFRNKTRSSGSILQEIISCAKDCFRFC